MHSGQCFQKRGSWNLLPKKQTRKAVSKAHGGWSRTFAAQRKAFSFIDQVHLFIGGVYNGGYHTSIQFWHQIGILIWSYALKTLKIFEPVLEVGIPMRTCSSRARVWSFQVPLRGFSHQKNPSFLQKNGWFLLAKETSCGHVVLCSCSCVTMYILDAACGFASSFFHCQAGETIVQKTIAELGLRYESCKVQLACLGWFFEMIFQKASTASRIIPRLCGRISLQKQFCQNIIKKRTNLSKAVNSWLVFQMRNDMIIV